MAIKLKGRNFQRLGVTTYSFEPEKLTDELLEEFGKRIVNQLNSFEELSGYRVSNNMREQFQQAIAARQQEREQELRPSQPSKEKKPGRLAKLFRKGEDEGASPPPAEPGPATATPPRPASAESGSENTGVTAKPSAKPAAKPVAKPAAKSASKPASRPVAGFKKYAWMVTGTGEDGESTNELVSRLGPGVEYHAGINNLVSRGAHFRMLGEDGKVRFSGYIVGECTGREPLEEFGQDRGCVLIEYERKGNWFAL